MPKILWSALPPAVRGHLLERGKARGVSARDLALLMEWKESDPDAPDGPWYKDFGTFKICGNGPLPLTFLAADQSAWGKKL